MKKIFILVVVCMMAFITSATAQTMQEVVYLKNGSIIKGIVIEQIPGASLKIQTYDGSIFVYPMSEVEKITKELATRQRNHNNTKPHHKEMTLDKGYRGFADLGITFGVGSHANSRLELMTTHGYQIIPQLFIGAGVGAHYYVDASDIAVPLFADIRYDILNTPITPFTDVKAGYSVAGITGFYFSPTLGCSFKTSDKLRLNLGVSYSMQNAPYFYYWNGFYWSDRANCHGLSIKVGIDF